MEMIWEASQVKEENKHTLFLFSKSPLMFFLIQFSSVGPQDLGTSSDLFTGILFNGYSPPDHFCYDIYCNDVPIKDNPNLQVVFVKLYCY